ncbi:hypothetical protein A7K94_0213955 [Modestobacter sp. VKM Ac-2676]|nr:hypothetical protein A7K94_0213955 [Modestobacter sp. VKM Ac-2676]
MMSTAEPVQPVNIAGPTTVRASALAAWQLVEDARYRPERRARADRLRMLAQRAVIARRAERDDLAG